MSHDVYFGATPDLTAADFKASWPVAMYYYMDVLTPGVTYYWRVDEVDAAGNKYTGNVWSFTVTPFEAHSPIPADAAENVAIDTTLQWTVGQMVAARLCTSAPIKRLWPPATLPPRLRPPMPSRPRSLRCGFGSVRHVLLACG